MSETQEQYEAEPTAITAPPVAPETVLLFATTAGEVKVGLYDGNEAEAETALLCDTFMRIIPASPKPSTLAPGVLVRDESGVPVLLTEPWPLWIAVREIQWVRVGRAAIWALEQLVRRQAQSSQPQATGPTTMNGTVVQ